MKAAIRKTESRLNTRLTSIRRRYNHILKAGDTTFKQGDMVRHRRLGTTAKITWVAGGRYEVTFPGQPRLYYDTDQLEKVNNLTVASSSSSAVAGNYSASSSSSSVSTSNRPRPRHSKGVGLIVTVKLLNKNPLNDSNSIDFRNLKSTDTIGSLKKKIYNAFKIKPKYQRLYSRTKRRLRSVETLASLKIKKYSTIYLTADCDLNYNTRTKLNGTMTKYGTTLDEVHDEIYVTVRHGHYVLKYWIMKRTDSLQCSLVSAHYDGPKQGVVLPKMNAIGGIWSYSEREIKLTGVGILEKGKNHGGICSLVCGYLLKCLIVYSGEEPPKKGGVHIVSPTPCRAFSCYKNAFSMNGYRLKNKQEVQQGLNEYIDELIERDLNLNDDSDDDDDDGNELGVDLNFERI